MDESMEPKCEENVADPTVRTEVEDGEIEDNVPEPSGDFKETTGENGFIEPTEKSLLLEDVNELDQSSFNRNDMTNELIIDESALSLNINESVNLPKEEDTGKEEDEEREAPNDEKPVSENDMSDIVSSMCDQVASEAALDAIAKANTEANNRAVDTMLPDILANPEDDDMLSEKMETSPINPPQDEDFKEETACGSELTEQSKVDVPNEEVANDQVQEESLIETNSSPKNLESTQDSPSAPVTSAEPIVEESSGMVELNTVDAIDSNQHDSDMINQEPLSNPSSNQVSCPNSNQASNSDTIIDSTAATDEEKNEDDKNIDDDVDDFKDEMKAEDEDSKKSDETAENKSEGKSKTENAKAETKEISNVKANGNSNGKPSDKSLNYYKSLSGKIRKFGSSYVFKQENIKSYTDTFGIDYKIGDHVYMDINKPNQPFAIACVLDFKLTKRDNLVIEVRWYYRPNEIPDSVYIPLMQDRVTEIASVATTDLAVLEPIIKGRELFASESTDIYPATFIKGKTRVFHYKDILDAKNFKPFADTFFCILTYNPEARRMADTHGEIRLGPSHQAKLPTCHVITEPLSEAEQRCDDTESVLWNYKAITDTNLFAFLQAARSVAAFAGMCERGSQDDMLEAVQSDSTTIHALNVLNESNYNTSQAIKKLVKHRTPKELCRMDQKWCEEDQKKFVKGLGQFGKNFFRIRKEMLMNKTTSEIVEYYYLWKKTAAAQSNRFRRRMRPSSVRKISSIAKTKPSSTSINTIKDNNNANSGSDNNDSDNENESDESSDQSSGPKCCTNCFTTSSKDLQNGGLDNKLLCYDCRMYYKKYGELPRIPNAKSESIVSDICEITNHLDKLESENMLELLNEQARKNALMKEEVKLDSEAKLKHHKGSDTPIKSEPVAKVLKTDPSLADKNSTKDFDSDCDDLSESKENKVKTESTTEQKHDANSNSEQQSSFMPVSNSKNENVSNKLNVSSSSPKPAFSPLNFMNPGPSQSPIPSFNPLNNPMAGMPFNPLTHSAFSHFFPPEIQQQLQNQQQKMQKQQQQQQNRPSSRSSNLNSSTCSSPGLTEDPETAQRPAIPCKISVNKPAELIKPDSNAMFVRIWDRGGITCSRTDLNFKYLPNAKYLRTKHEKKHGTSNSSSSGHNTSINSSKTNSNGNDNLNTSTNGSSNTHKKTNGGSKPAADSNNHQMNNSNGPPPMGQLPQIPGMPPMNLSDPSKIPPHLLPFLSMMAGYPGGMPGQPGNPNQRQMTPQELEAGFINELLKSQMMNQPHPQHYQPQPQQTQQPQQKTAQQQKQPQQQHNQHQQQQHLMKQQDHQQKLAFTEQQILEQAKRSMEAQQMMMAMNQNFNMNPNELKNMQQQAAAMASMQHGMPPGYAGNGMPPRFPGPGEFDMNSPALKQLSEIANGRNGSPFAPGAMNPNSFNPNAFMFPNGR